MRNNITYILEMNSQYKAKHGSASTVVTYHCAQHEGVQTKHQLHIEEKKQWGSTCMAHFQCKGVLQVTIPDDSKNHVRIRMLHAEPHIHYMDIAIPENIWKLIVENKGSAASSVSLYCICKNMRLIEK